MLYQEIEEYGANRDITLASSLKVLFYGDYQRANVGNIIHIESGIIILCHSQLQKTALKSHTYPHKKRNEIDTTLE